MKTLGNTIIFGDSYSTYKGWLNEGNPVYSYYGDIDAEKEGGLTKPEQTWWLSLINETGSTLVMNDSWSGSTVSYSHYGTYDPPASFVDRAKKYLQKGLCNGKKIDTVLIFGGTNDNWGDSPVGVPQYENWTNEDLKAFLPALACMISYIKKDSPDARIINITNTELKPEITEGMAEVCKTLGVTNVVLHDVGKNNGHPNADGMQAIKNQIIEAL